MTVSELRPEDFQMEMDPAVFNAWKEEKKKDEKLSKIRIAVCMVGVLLMFVIKGVVGVVILCACFAAAVAFGFITKRKLKELQKQLGITNKQVNELLIPSAAEDAA